MICDIKAVEAITNLATWLCKLVHGNMCAKRIAPNAALFTMLHLDIHANSVSTS